MESFNEEKVVVYHKHGRNDSLRFDFKVNRLSVEDGQLIIDGEVDKVEYMEVADNDDRGRLRIFQENFLDK